MVAAVALGMITPGVAHAAPPANDDFDASTPIAALPFVTQVDRTEATRALDDPANCVQRPAEGSVWFHRTATEDGIFRVSTDGSDLDVKLTVLSGTRGDLRSVGCSSPGTPFSFRMTAGQTYYFMASDGYNGRGATLALSLQQLTPPANDNFADAQQVTSLPFSAPQPDFATASAEPDEPWTPACPGVREGTPTVWYSYTPTTTQSVHGQVLNSGPVLGVYEGSSLSGLRTLGCVNPSYNNGKAFRFVAGTTYRLQLQYSFYSANTATLRLSEAAPLQTSLSRSYDERSIFDNITLSVYHQNHYDQPVMTEWDFGDGTVLPPSTDTSKTHRYSSDGTYTVTVRSTSEDGRTATSSTPVVVKTHDVGIAKLGTPSSARAGEQKAINVRVSNTRYLEKGTTVTLYKWGEFGWQSIGSLSLDVPAHPTRKVTFPFSYTFTAEDAIRGKQNFRATVSLPYPARDALPLDNEAISTATTVLPAATAGSATAN
ncbi:PKD domain-containing protein [Lentzea albidocapillata subsp. violacea]|uniref:PKD domain-containing protein n=1 Tax=Lentzea albidocapillata subsp. violacea TaxID=128104 RepID=A0A1G9NU68_9PSEU|nr:PKD domain-containing protein [Lentzea albidocapillata subsp. violacea]